MCPTSKTKNLINAEIETLSQFSRLPVFPPTLTTFIVHDFRMKNICMISRMCSSSIIIFHSSAKRSHSKPMFEFEFLLILSESAGRKRCESSANKNCLVKNDVTCFPCSSSLRLSSDWIIWANMQRHVGSMSLQRRRDGTDVQSMCSRLPAESITYCPVHQ